MAEQNPPNETAPSGRDPLDQLAGMRVLFGPIDVASLPSRLARALAANGARCRVLNLSPHPYHASLEQYGKAKPIGAAWIGFSSRLQDKGVLGKVAGSLIKTVLRWAVFLWSLWAVNAVVLVTRQSLIRGNLDLICYRLLGKRVVRVCTGTDSRMRLMTGQHPRLLDPAKHIAAAKDLAKKMKRQRGRLRWLTRWSNAVTDNPLSGHFHPEPFINWFQVGFPFSEDQAPAIRATDAAQRREDDTIKILHSPSNPQVKGTERINQAIASLKDQGFNIDYRAVTGVPRNEILRELAHCDLVIDQLYSDSPMSGLASEAAALGKPTIVGGFGWDLIKATLPPHRVPPTALTDPQHLEETLKDLLSDRQRRENIGRQVRDFTLTQWSEKEVASRFTRVLLGGDWVPDAWWCDPTQVSYWQGYGADAQHRRAVMTAYVQALGIDALMVPPQCPFALEVQRWIDPSSSRR